MTPLVSIVMAAKDYARFLPDSIGSVLAQTCADWELILIDDGSTDGTPDTVRPYLSDPRIRYVQVDRLGQTRAKSLGVSLTRGEFVAFLDADDAWLPTKLEKQLAVFRKHPEAGVVYCRRSLMDEHGRPITISRTATPERGFILSRLLVENFVCFSSALVRRLVLSHVGTFDPQWGLAIDYDLWLRIARHYPFEFVDEELVRYRTGHGNLSRKLRDRVETAFSIMHRAASRREIAAEVPARAIAEAHSTTSRTLGYVMRPSEPLTALRWYLRALAYPEGRLASVKGVIASILRWVSFRRTAGSAENATVNR